MFKKDPNIKALSNLKNSDRKKTLQTICKTYLPDDTLPSEILNLVLPQTVKQTNFKSPLGFSGTIYTDNDGIPVWFKTKDSDLFPSVYTVWKVPFLLPIVRTHEHVIEIMSGGADLMLPGMSPPFDARATKGKLVAVASTQKPNLVRAIGRVKINLPEYTRVIGETGVAVEILHVVDDELFKLNKIKVEEPLEFLADPRVQPAQEDTVEETSEPETNERENSEEPTEDNDLAETIDKLSIEDVDHFFTRSLYYSLTQDKIDTPITASTFMAAHVLHNLPDIDLNQLQIKKTSWKKTAKFLKHFEKEGFLKLKGKGDDVTIVSIASTNDKDELKNFVPYKIHKKNSGAQASTEETSKLKSLTLYKPTGNSRMFFNDMDMNFAGFYTSNELRDKLNAYITKHKLASPTNKKAVLLDDVLQPMIRNKDGNTITRDKILALFLNNFTEHYQLFNQDVPMTKQPQKGRVPRISIVTEMKLGRKVITRVSNFEIYGIDSTELANELKHKCSGSATTQPLVSNPKITEVQVQGPHGSLIIELLGQYGVPSTWIDFENKVKPKKKRS